MSFLFISLPWLSNKLLWSINIYLYMYIYIYIYMVFKRKNIDFIIFRPKASSVKSNFFTCYISLLYIYKNCKKYFFKTHDFWGNNNCWNKNFKKNRLCKSRIVLDWSCRNNIPTLLYIVNDLWAYRVLIVSHVVSACFYYNKFAATNKKT